jgi:hypothetical protein
MRPGLVNGERLEAGMKILPGSPIFFGKGYYYRLISVGWRRNTLVELYLLLAEEGKITAIRRGGFPRHTEKGV